MGNEKGMMSRLLAWRIRFSCEKCYKKFEMVKHPDDNTIPCAGVRGSLFCPSCKHLKRPLKINIVL